jgi:hypothetical protein
MTEVFWWWGAGLVLLLAVVPWVMDRVNAFAVRGVATERGRVSVIIPARNEVAGIAECVRSFLEDAAVSEVVVVDDGSTDGTGAAAMAVADERVRVVLAGALPEGWAGKMWACSVGAGEATGEIFVFTDADVRLVSGSGISECADVLERGRLGMLSGVPEQELGTWAERLVVPLILFVLKGYLPFSRMRAGTDSRFAAGCGQFLMFRRSAYLAAGGHGAARGSFHEGIVLARSMRAAGFSTDLVDLRGVVRCRMYEGFLGVVRGFAKNAHEGLGAPVVRWVMGGLLLGGGVLPWLGVVWRWSCEEGVLWGLAAALGVWVRLRQVRLHGGSYLGAIFHPVGVLLLLGTQWYGLARRRMGRAVTWRGRGPVAVATAAATVLCSWAAGMGSELKSGGQPLKEWRLRDQFAKEHHGVFPGRGPVVLVVGDRKSSGQIEPWMRFIAPRVGERAEIVGVADLRGMPHFLEGMVRMGLRSGVPKWPVLMDLDGTIALPLGVSSGVLRIVVLDRAGGVVMWRDGAFTERVAEEIVGAVKKVEVRK